MQTHAHVYLNAFMFIQSGSTELVLDVVTGLKLLIALNFCSIVSIVRYLFCYRSFSFFFFPYCKLAQ